MQWLLWHIFLFILHTALQSDKALLAHERREVHKINKRIKIHRTLQNTFHPICPADQSTSLVSSQQRSQQPQQQSGWCSSSLCSACCPNHVCDLTNTHTHNPSLRWSLITSHVTGRKLSAGYRAPSLTQTSHAAMRFHRRVWYRALSLRYACIQSSGIILIP